MSSVRPFARLRTQCPYCDHVSPAGSKFCNDCGAALHLAPCPHCGAVNDLTLTETCARCNGELQNSSRPDKPATSLTLVTDPMPLDEVETVESAERDLPPQHPPSSGLQLRHVGVAVFLIGAAVAGYYVYPPRVPVQQSLPAPPPPAAALGITPPPFAAGPEPVPVPVPGVEPPADATASPKPAAVAVARRVRPQAVPAESPPRQDYNSSTPVEPPPPHIGPCTDAVAALGLCTNNEATTPRRQ